MMKNISEKLWVTLVMILIIVSTSTSALAQNPGWIDLTDKVPRTGFINQLAFDSKGNLWMTSPLMQYDGETWVVHSDTALGHELNNASSLAIDALDNIWIGCYEADGLVRFDGEDWSYFDLRDWGFPENVVYSLSIDQQGVIWIGTAAGLARFDGTMRSVCDPSNSPILSTEDVQSIAIDDNNVKWIGINGEQDGTILSFDDTTWTVYNESNTGVDFGYTRSIVIDSSRKKWILGDHKLYNLARYYCTSYDVPYSRFPDSGLPGGGPWCMAIDRDDAIWIGTGEIGGIMMPSFSGGGLMKYDGLNWTILDTSNSEIPGNFVSALAINENGNIWMASIPIGLAIYNPAGIVGLHDEVRPIPEKMTLYQNYPNPFNPSTTINYDLPEQSQVKLAVFDIVGREVITLDQSEKLPGNYEVTWNGLDQSGNPMSTGVYFARLQAGDYSKSIKMLYLK